MSKKENINNQKLDLSLLNIDQDFPEIDELNKYIIMAFNEMDINPNGKCVYYKRNGEDYSQLGIQVGDGDSEDLENYMFFDRTHEEYGDVFKRSTVSMHIPGKISFEGNMVVNLISEYITNFFDKIEESFKNAKCPDFKCEIMKNIVKQKVRTSFVDRIRDMLKIK